MKKFIFFTIALICAFSVFCSGCIFGVPVAEDSKKSAEMVNEFKQGFLSSPENYRIYYCCYEEDEAEEFSYKMTREVIFADTDAYRCYADLNYEKGQAVYSDGEVCKDYDASTDVESLERTEFCELEFVRFISQLFLIVRDEVLGIMEYDNQLSLFTHWPFYRNAYNLEFVYNVDFALGGNVYTLLKVFLISTSDKEKLSFSIEVHGTAIVYINESVPDDYERCAGMYTDYINRQRFQDVE